MSILSLDLPKMRVMTEDDLSMVLKWRNDATVRLNMLSTSPITMESHVSWFHTNSADLDQKLLIFEIEKQPLGFVGVYKTGEANTSSWGFYKAPGAPKGIGNELCNAALSYIFCDFQKDKIVATVLKNNFVSLGLHKKLGFEKCVIGDSQVCLIDRVLLSLNKIKWKNRKRM